MKEAIGNTETVRSFEFIGYWAFKIPDVMGSRFTQNKPFDVVVCSPKGRFIAVEGKMIKKWEKLSSKDIRPHQVVHLDAIAKKRGGRSFVFLYVRIPGDTKKGQKRVCKLVVFDWMKHREALTGEGYGVALLREQKVGVWLDPTQDEDGKLIWPLKGILKL